MTLERVVIGLAGLLLGCGGNGSNEAAGDAGTIDGGPVRVDLSRLEGLEPGDENVTFSSLFDRHFDSCIGAGCHEGGAFGIAPLIGLNFTTPDLAYAQLVGSPSLGQSGMLRVAPGEPDQSYLLAKLLDDPIIQGGPMPLPPQELLSDAAIAEVAEWIRRGAADD